MPATPHLSARLAALIVAAILGVATLFPSPAAADQSPVVEYRPPVPGRVVDPFRAPAGPYAAGNRGLDLETTPGEPVRAVADGEVVFAGPVAGTLHVVVLHGDGIRSSLSFLATISTTRGAHVRRGDVVGTAGASVHVGLRRAGAYLDPTPYLAGSRPTRVRLVPDDQHPLPAAEEASRLHRLLGAGSILLHRASDLASALTAVGVADPGALQAALATGLAWAGDPTLVAARLVAAIAVEEAGNRPCTSSSTAPPVAPAAAHGRRLLVLVGGLGSGTGDASVLGLGTAALGYAPTDVIQAGYLGASAVDEPYGPAATSAGIDAPAAHLAGLLRDLAAANPGVPIDVIGHSMGGLVARGALALHSTPPEPPVERLITIATPHGGADIAQLAVAARIVPGMHVAEGIADRLPLPVDPSSQSVTDLAPGSTFLRRLDAATPPPRLQVTSIAGRTDVVVPSLRARPAWPGARTVVVDGPPGVGLGAHGALPASIDVAREVALAVGDRAPTCRSRRDIVLDAAFAIAVEAVEG